MICRSRRLSWGSEERLIGSPTSARKSARAKKLAAARRAVKAASRDGFFAADAVVAAEEPVRIVPALDLQKTRVVGAPEGALPVRLEVVRFVDVGAAAGRGGADDVHGGGDAGPGLSALGSVRMVPGHLVRPATIRSNDDQRRGVEDDGIDGCLARPPESVRGGGGLTLAEID